MTLKNIFIAGKLSGGDGGYPEPTGTKEINITENGTTTENVKDYANAEITVNVSSGGGVPENDVMFYDYDGTVVAAYSAADFANLEALPEKPTHEGLTAQGWTRTLVDAKNYVQSFGKLDIGQNYITTSGNTEIDVEMYDGSLSPRMGLYVQGEVSVDWGDGSSPDTLTGNSISSSPQYASHNYVASGSYTIVLTPVSGDFAIMGGSSGTSLLTDGSSTYSSVYAHCIRRARMGTNVRLGDYAFYNAYLLESITMPRSIKCGISVFRRCRGLRHIVLPVNINVGNYFAAECYSLASVSFSVSHELLNYAFYECHALRRVTDVFVGSSSGNAFQNCYSLMEAYISPAGGSSYKPLESDIFSYDANLTDVSLSDFTSIASSAFSACSSLQTIRFPASVISIQSSVLNNCTSLKSIYFEATTPPTSSGNFWNNVPTDCKIYVPSGTLADYTSASNYPPSSTYTYVEY